MKFIGVALLVLFKIYQMENRMLPYSYVTENPDESFNPANSSVSTESQSIDSSEHEKMIGPKIYDDREDEEIDKPKKHPSKKPCAIVVLSSAQNPSMQSLLRRYRYDSKGVLIPSSVKYFIKYPQGFRDSPILVPLNDKAFSPLGGFVRYYKEVPPIPHSF